MNVFIDLGSHSGAILRKFVASKSYAPDFVLHAFEPNPKINEQFFSIYPSGTIIHREAAYISDGEIDLYINAQRPAIVQGSSIFKEKITGDLDKLHPAKVKTIDFSKWLLENFSESDNVIIKCNIEGAEYPVFSKIMDDGNMGIIKKLILKRHWNKIGMPQEDDLKFLNRLKLYSHLELTDKYEF
jgi:FkbM family methyltransferase